MKQRTREILTQLCRICDEVGMNSDQFYSLSIELARICVSDKKEAEEVKRVFQSMFGILSDNRQGEA